MAARWINSTTYPTTLTMADIMKTAESFRKRREEDDRNVFRFDGTLDEFKAKLAEQGVQVIKSFSGLLAIASEPPLYNPGMPLEFGLGLEVHVIGDSVCFGTAKAMRRLLRGPLPDLSETELLGTP